MKRLFTNREKIGYKGENLAIKILEGEGFRSIRKGAGPFDLVAEKNSELFLIDVKTSSVDDRRLPVHDHSLVDLINLCRVKNAKPLILVVKPSRYCFVDTLRLLQGVSNKDVYLYRCYLRKGWYKDIEEMLRLRAKRPDIERKEE